MIAKNLNNRRSFIKKTLGTAALTAITPVISFAGDEKSTPEEKENNIVYRTLGKRTGINIPVISMGAGDTNSASLLNAALDSGVKMLATAQYYGNGNNEKIIGDSVIKNRSRNSYIIATSAQAVGFNYKEGVFNAGAKADQFLKSVDGCLERLGVEYADIFFLPGMAKKESVFYEPYLKAMEQVKKSGKAKYIGIATHSWEDEAIKAATDVGIYDVVMTAYNFKKENIKELDESIEYAANAGLGIIAMKTMAGVFWDKEKTVTLDSKAAIKWALQNKNIHTTVPGVTTFDQLNQNWKIMNNMELSQDEINNLKIAQSKTDQGIYCQQCGKCIKDCPYDIDIPTAMRSYMYAFGYGNYTQASETFKLSCIDELPCSSCDECNVLCPQSFNVRKKLADAYSIKNIPDNFLI